MSTVIEIEGETVNEALEAIAQDAERQGSSRILLTPDAQRRLIEQLRSTQKQIDWCATAILAAGNSQVSELSRACDALEEAIGVVCLAKIISTEQMAQRRAKAGAR